MFPRERVLELLWTRPCCCGWVSFTGREDRVLGGGRREPTFLQALRGFQNVQAGRLVPSKGREQLPEVPGPHGDPPRPSGVLDVFGFASVVSPRVQNYEAPCFGSNRGLPLQRRETCNASSFLLTCRTTRLSGGRVFKKNKSGKQELNLSRS